MAAENSGGRVNYYLVEVKHPQRETQQPYQAECEDIIHALGMTFDEGNIFKEVWRQAAARQGRAKEGNTPLRGAQKLVHYAGRILRQAGDADSDEYAWKDWGGKLSYPAELNPDDVVQIQVDGTGTIIVPTDRVRVFLWKHTDCPEGHRIIRYRKVKAV